MPTYRVGSLGREVESIQRQLADLGLYGGPIDGVFEGGTASAVVAFQRGAGLNPDGRVSEQTWARLFPEESPQPGAPVPGIVGKPLDARCLALTASIETSRPPPECFAAITGDFDGQGLSFGALQFALAAGSLGELVQELDQRHPGVVDQVFHHHAEELRQALALPRKGRVEWARSIQDTRRFQVAEPWRGMWKALGRREDCQAVQVHFARRKLERARAMCAEYGVWSERAVALMFDVIVQNGSINGLVRSQIMRDFTTIGPMERDMAEVARLRIVARRRAEACNPRWIDRVRVRKLAIADGAGVIHGREYDLAGDYGIRLLPFA